MEKDSQLSDYKEPTVKELTKKMGKLNMHLKGKANGEIRLEED